MTFPLVHPRSSCKTQSLQTLDQKKPQEKQSGSRAIFQLVKSQFLCFGIFGGQILPIWEEQFKLITKDFICPDRKETNLTGNGSLLIIYTNIIAKKKI